MWRSNDGELVLGILDALKVKPGTCAVLGQCMGAAMIMRAVAIAEKRGRESPFSGHFIFHNATVGSWVEELTGLVEGGKGKILAWHEVDGDHMREGESEGRKEGRVTTVASQPQLTNPLLALLVGSAVAYKNLAKLALKFPDKVTFIDNDNYRREGLTDEILETSSLDLPKHLKYLNPRSESISYKDAGSAVILRVVKFVNSSFPNPKPALADFTRSTALSDPSYKPGRFNVFIRVRPPRTSNATLKFTETTVAVQSSTLEFARVFPPSAGLPALASSADSVINAGTLR